MWKRDDENCSIITILSSKQYLAGELETFVIQDINKNSYLNVAAESNTCFQIAVCNTMKLRFYLLPLKISTFSLVFTVAFKREFPSSNLSSIIK